MNRCLVCVALLAAACGKSERKSGLQPDRTPPAPVAAPPEPKGPDAACAAKLDAFKPFITALERERRSYEIDFGYKLHAIAREPSPVTQMMDTVAITPIRIEAFDTSEADHAASTLGRNPPDTAIVDRLTQIHAKQEATTDRIRFDIDAGSSWADVVRVASAATTAGYKEVIFVFTATSALTPPPGVPAKTEKAEDVDAAAKRLTELQALCKPWRNVALVHKPVPEPLADSDALASEIVGGLGACNCAADIDEVRKQMFIEARWHQATPRVGVTVTLGKGQTVAAPAKALWSEASAALLAAPSGPLELVAQ